MIKKKNRISVTLNRKKVASAEKKVEAKKPSRSISVAMKKRIKAAIKKRIAEKSKKNAVSKRVAMKAIKARRAVVARKTDILAKRLAERLDARMERILLDAEKLIKASIPAKFVSASLTKLQKELITNGISCTFDKRVAKSDIKKTASTDITEDECNDAVKKIAQAVIGLTEDTLDACDKAIKQLSKKHFAKNRVSSVCMMRKNVEARMKKTGLNFKF